jgi:hypothetical protein
MKLIAIVSLLGCLGLFSSVGLASFGNAAPPPSGTLVLFGLGLVALALWGRRLFRK